MPNQYTKAMEDGKHKPIIETLINTAALAMTSFAIYTLTQASDGWEQWIKGLLLLIVGMGLEFWKYIGRKKKLW